MPSNEEKFFIPQPKLTDLTAQGPNALLPIYKCDGFPNEMKWSGKLALPAVGDGVYILINSIGWGTVQGYAESHGFLGLLVKPENPPEWWMKQRKRNQDETKRAIKIGPEKAAIERLRVWPQWVLDGICCVFGVEIALEAPAPKVRSGN